MPGKNHALPRDFIEYQLLELIKRITFLLSRQLICGFTTGGSDGVWPKCLLKGTR